MSLISVEMSDYRTGNGDMRDNHDKIPCFSVYFIYFHSRIYVTRMCRYQIRPSGNYLPPSAVTMSKRQPDM